MKKITLINKNYIELVFEFNKIKDLNDVLKHREIIIGNNVTFGNNCILSAKTSIGDGTKISDNVYIGKSATIGNKSKINKGVRIEKRSEIGKNNTLHENCVIKDRAILGDNVTIHAGIVIGSQNNVDANTELNIAFYKESEYEDMVYVGNNKLSVGCETHDISKWKDIAYMLGEEKGVSETAVSKYLADAEEIELILKSKK